MGVGRMGEESLVISFYGNGVCPSTGAKGKHFC